jgi:hypothetical protein
MHQLPRLIVTLSAVWLALKAAVVLARARSGGASETPLRDAHDPDWL